MRSDERVAARSRDLARGRFGGEPGNANSLSGHERNHLFAYDPSRGNFVDVSAIGGVDHEADGRSFAILDYDRDGALDLVVVNANDPFALLFRNQTGERAGAQRRGMIAVRLIGGGTGDRADPAWSPRDPYGAMVLAEIAGGTLRRDLHCGEGFAAQNTRLLMFGLGERRAVDSLRVRWPSGRTTQLPGIPEGSLVTVYEDPRQAPAPEGYTVERYRRRSAPRPGRARAGGERLAIHRAAGAARLYLYTTVATWCEACKRELPQVAVLRAALPTAEVELLGVPVDPEDDAERLRAFEREYKPAYRLLADLDLRARAALRDFLRRELRVEVLPSSVVCDAQGRVLKVLMGVPSVSEVRALLRGR